MDKSLDEVITARKTSRRRRPSAKAQVLGNAANPATRAAAANATAAKVAATNTAQPAEKIIVSNLPADVNEAQIKELFHTTVGPLREVTLHYDSAGRSKGVAAIHFQKKGDGSRAFQQYNNRLIDGKRPMKIEIVVDPSRPAAQSLASRVAPAAAAAAAVPTTRVARTASRGRRAVRGRGRKPNERPQKSVADLDAEMEDYTAANTGSAAPAVVAA